MGANIAFIFATYSAKLYNEKTIIKKIIIENRMFSLSAFRDLNFTPVNKIVDKSSNPFYL